MANGHKVRPAGMVVTAGQSVGITAAVQCRHAGILADAAQYCAAGMLFIADQVECFCMPLQA